MKLIKYFSILFCLMALASCRGSLEDIFSPIVDINLPPHTSKLVVFANFNADSDSLSVYLTRSRSALDTTTPKILVRVDTIGYVNGVPRLYPIYVETDTLKNAKVELFRNDVLWGTFKTNYFNVYSLRQKLVADGATYRLRVEVAGYDVVEATQKMPIPAKLDSARYVPNGAVIQDGLDTYKSNEYTYFFTDPADLGNHYFVQVAYLDTTFRVPFVYYPKSLDKLAQSGFLSDKSFNGKSYIWRNYDGRSIRVSKGNSLEYTLFTTTSDLFQFIRSKELNANARDNPFAEPVILYSNIKNGYGIFTLTTASTWIKRY